MPDSISLVLGILAALDLGYGAAGVACVADFYLSTFLPPRNGGLSGGSFLFVVLGISLVLAGLVFALPVAVLTVTVAIRRHGSWIAAFWAFTIVLTAGAVYVLMFAPEGLRQWLAITGQTLPGTQRGTVVAGMALLLPLGALVYGFWRQVPSRWVPVGCGVVGALLAAGLVVTR